MKIVKLFLILFSFLPLSYLLAQVQEVPEWKISTDTQPGETLTMAFMAEIRICKITPYLMCCYTYNEGNCDGKSFLL